MIITHKPPHRGALPSNNHHPTLITIPPIKDEADEGEVVVDTKTTITETTTTTIMLTEEAIPAKLRERRRQMYIVWKNFLRCDDRPSDSTHLYILTTNEHFYIEEYTSLAILDDAATTGARDLHVLNIKSVSKISQ